MKRTLAIVTICLALAAGAGAFVVTLGPAGTGPGVCGAACPLGRWLNMPEPQCQAVCAADRGFSAEARQLLDDLARQREALAILLDDPASSDRPILDQVEQVIAAHDALERRVARHILVIRPYLTSDQARRLMGLCAQGVRRQGCCAGPQPGVSCTACPGSAGDTQPKGAASAE